MIESVMVYKNNRTVETRYQSGAKRTHLNINEKELAFILRNDIKGFENEMGILYRKPIENIK